MYCCFWARRKTRRVLQHLAECWPLSVLLGAKGKTRLLPCDDVHNKRMVGILLRAVYTRKPSWAASDPLRSSR